MCIRDSLYSLELSDSIYEYQNISNRRTVMKNSSNILNNLESSRVRLYISYSDEFSVDRFLFHKQSIAVRGIDGNFCSGSKIE